jgi:hypothetical protein
MLRPRNISGIPYGHLALANLRAAVEKLPAVA